MESDSEHVDDRADDDGNDSSYVSNAEPDADADDDDTEDGSDDHVGPRGSDGVAEEDDAGNPASYPGSGTTWTDLSGNGNNGTLVNGPTYTTLNNGGVVLDNVDDFISISPSPSLKVDAGNFTIFSVHKLGVTVDIYGNFFYQSGDGSGVGTNKSIFFQRNGNDTLMLDFYGNGGSFNFGTNSVAANTLLFIAVSFNKSALTSVFFRNGTFSPTQTHTGSPNFTTLSSVQIGKRYTNGSGPSTKDLDGTNYITLLYNRALSANEILQNYNATKSRYNL
jgi:hypothetical protein